MFLRVFLVLILVSNLALAQNSALFATEFNFVSSSSSAVGFLDSNVTFKYPTNYKTGVLTHSLTYSNYNIDYNSNEMLNEDKLGIESFKSISYTLEFNKNILNNWSYSISVSPIISSNFDSTISWGDLFFDGSVVFSKDFAKNKLQLGVVKNLTFGFNTPIPLITIDGLINKKLTYSIGFPVTEFLYKVNATNKFSLYAKPKGFYANITNEILVNVNDEVKRAQYQSIISGLKYSHCIDDNWKIEVDAGYQLKSDYELLDKNLNSVYEFKTKNNFSAGVSLKFNLINDKS